MDYLDFGSTSESDDNDDNMVCELDSDEEERRDNKRLLKMFNFYEPPSKNQRDIQDFEAEMEAELDRRASEAEAKGGMEHQKSLSRSSSNTSLNKQSPRASPIPGTSSSSSETHLAGRKSNLKRRTSNSSDSGKKTKSVKFASTEEDTPVNHQTAVQCSPVASASTNIAEKLYDELYFDSDDEEGESKVKQKRRFMTDDELFYDPSSDARDQAWIDKKRRKAYGESKAFPPPSTHETKKANDSATHTSASDKDLSSAPDLPSTDAILNCPACFTTVCHDCQRHELYAGQYRAMFVSNCVVNKQETLKIPEKKNAKKDRKRNKPANESAQFVNDSGSDVFHPVACKVCKTQLAMYDNDEVFHFFNVLASQP